MSYNFKNIPRLVWGCGDDRYGDKNAKEKAIEIISKESHVFVATSIIRDHTDIDLRELENTTDQLYTFGFPARSVPTDVAIKLLQNFQMGYFDGFMLRDVNLMSADALARYRIDYSRYDTHLVLDFDGYGTDHCYD